MKFKIIKNAERPPRAKGAGKPAKYPFDKLEEGQAFEATLNTKEEGKKLRNAAYQYAKNHGIKFAVNISADKGKVIATVYREIYAND